MFNWREVPFVRLLLPFVIGIGLAFYFDLPVTEQAGYAFSFLLPILGFLLIAIIWLGQKKLAPSSRVYFSLFVHLFLIIFGYYLTFENNSFHKADHFRHYLTAEDIGVGRVLSISKSGKFDRAVIDMEQIGSNQSQPKHTLGQVLLLVDRSEDNRAINYGDRITFKSKITSLNAPKNPNAFDFRHLLRVRGIYHQTFVKSHQWQTLSTNQGSPFLTKVQSLRTHLISVLQKHLSTNNEFAVGSAMLLGDKSALQDEIKNAYAGTGATHVMAVSGLHLGIIFLGIGTLLRLIKTRNRFFRFFKPAVMIAGIWLFALLTGASPSAMRAAVMFSFLIVGQSLVRFVNIYNTLAISAFCLLCYQPYLLFETGFQLSYLAVVGIVFFQSKIYRLWIIDNKLGDYIWKLATVGLAAQLTTFPLSLFYFNQFPLYFWLSGLVVVPAAFLIICAGIGLFIMETIFPAAAIWIGKLLYGIIWLMNSIIFLIRQLPAGLIDGIWIGALVFILLYMAVITLSIAINTEKKKWLIYGLACFSLIAVNYAFTATSHQTQQQIVLYHTPKNTLIDFVDGRQLISFRNATIPEKSARFASERNHWALGVNHIKQVNTNKNQSLHFDNLIYKSNIIQFRDKTIALVNELPIGKHKLSQKIDYLILYENPDLKIAQLQDYFDFNEIWFATSNSYYKIKAWEDECVSLRIPFSTVSSEGAIVKPINSKK